MLTLNNLIYLFLWVAVASMYTFFFYSKPNDSLRYRNIDISGPLPSYSILPLLNGCVRLAYWLYKITLLQKTWNPNGLKCKHNTLYTQVTRNIIHDKCFKHIKSFVLTVSWVYDKSASLCIFLFFLQRYDLFHACTFIYIKAYIKFISG